jgi:hypothetical protein
MCSDCGKRGSVLTLGVEPPPEAKLLDASPLAAEHHEPTP